MWLACLPRGSSGIQTPRKLLLLALRGLIYASGTACAVNRVHPLPGLLFFQFRFLLVLESELEMLLFGLEFSDKILLARVDGFFCS